MLERGTAGSTDYVVSHEKALGGIILCMRERDRKKAIPSSAVTNALHGTGTCGCSRTAALKLNAPCGASWGNLGQAAPAAQERRGFGRRQVPIQGVS